MHLRLEFGTKYCHNSPTLDEEKLHQAIQEAINEFAQAGTEVKEDMLTFTAMAWGAMPLMDQSHRPASETEGHHRPTSTTAGSGAGTHG